MANSDWNWEIPGAQSRQNEFDSTYRTGASLGSSTASSSSVNPASTFSFMLNMGYPPPPMALEGLRRTLENVTNGSTPNLNLGVALRIVDDIQRSPFRISQAVLFVLQQRLHSSKPDRVYLSLELLDVCVKNCGLDFARHINKEFMKSMTGVLKTTSFKDRTITGQVKKLEKFLTGSPSTGVATDPRIHKIKKKILYLMQTWVDAFMMQADDVPAIMDAYKNLKKKGTQFPPSDPSNKYFIRHGEESPAFDPSAANPNGPSQIQRPVEDNDPPEGDSPLTEKQCNQLERMVGIFRTSDNGQLIDKCLAICDKLAPKLNEAAKTAAFNISHNKSKKLQASDANVLHLNVIMDLEAEIKKKRGYGVLSGQRNQTSVSTSHPTGPVSGGSIELIGSVTKHQQRGVQLATDLLDDSLLSSPSDGKTTSVPVAQSDNLDNFEFASPDELWGSKATSGVPQQSFNNSYNHNFISASDAFATDTIWDRPARSTSGMEDNKKSINTNSNIINNNNINNNNNILKNQPVPVTARNYGAFDDLINLNPTPPAVPVSETFETEANKSLEWRQSSLKSGNGNNHDYKGDVKISPAVNDFVKEEKEVIQNNNTSILSAGQFSYPDLSQDGLTDQMIDLSESDLQQFGSADSSHCSSGVSSSGINKNNNFQNNNNNNNDRLTSTERRDDEIDLSDAESDESFDRRPVECPEYKNNNPVVPQNSINEKTKISNKDNFAVTSNQKGGDDEDDGFGDLIPAFGDEHIAFGQSFDIGDMDTLI